MSYPYFTDLMFREDTRRALQDRIENLGWYDNYLHDHAPPAPITGYGRQFIPLRHAERSYGPYTDNRDPYPDEDEPTTSAYSRKVNSPEALQEQLHGITNFKSLLHIWNRVHRLMDAETHSETRTAFRQVSERCEYKCRTIINSADNSEFVRILKTYCAKETFPHELPRLLQERLKTPALMQELLRKDAFMILLRNKDTAKMMAFLLSMGYLHEGHVDEFVRREYG